MLMVIAGFNHEPWVAVRRKAHNSAHHPATYRKVLHANSCTRRIHEGLAEAATRPCEAMATRLHDLRHFHVTALIATGAHPKIVQERLGHSSAAFTMNRYGHVNADMQLEAVEKFARLMAGEQ